MKKQKLFHRLRRAFGMKDEMITYVPLNESHIPWMSRWLSGGEAMRWCGDDEPPSEAQLRQKYLIDKPRGGTHCFIIYYDGEPIGHVQYYRVTDYPEWCSLVSGQPHDYGLDLFIGRDDLIGQGIGTQAVNDALAQLVFQCEDAKRCMLGPSPDNSRAIRCYEKSGFRHARTLTTDTGEQEYVMITERPNNPDAGDA